MKIAVVSSKTIGQTDLLISNAAEALESDGVRLSGVVKILDSEKAGDHHCDMDLRVLPDGPEIRITQSLGEGSKGCRLNPAAISEAVIIFAAICVAVMVLAVISLPSIIVLA